MSVSAAANALATVANVKYVLGKAQANTSDDDRLQTLINLISGRIADWCGRDFISATYMSELHDGDGSKQLFVTHAPVSSLDTVTVNDAAVDITELNAYDADVKINYATGCIYKNSRWPAGVRNIAITYKSVYSAAVPKTIESVCIEWVIMLYEGRMKDANVKGADAPAGAASMPGRFVDALSPFMKSGIR